MAEVKKLRTGHTYTEICQEDTQRILKDFPMFDGFVRLQPGGWFVSSTLPPVLDKIYDFDFKQGDTVVITYPKSGTTWMQEIVWNLTYNPDLNNPDAKIPSDLRSPHIEADMILRPKKIPKIDETSKLYTFLQENAPGREKEEDLFFALAETVTSPRIMKSHMAISLFPPSMLQNCKVIYVSRDPRDVIVSKFHFWVYMLPYSYKGTLDDFIDYFVNEEQYNHPYWLHVKEAYDQRHHPNILFIHFEDLKANPTKTVTQISEFLGLNRTPDQIKNVVDYTDFQNMKKLTDTGEVSQPMTDGGKYVAAKVADSIVVNKSNEGLFRKGKSGDWKDSFTEEQAKKITAWMNKNMKMFPADFKYKA